MNVIETHEPTGAPHFADTLLEYVHAGVFVSRGFQFLYINQRLGEMLGMSVAELMEKMDAFAILHPDDQPKVLDVIHRRGAGHITDAYDVRMLGRGGRVITMRACGRHINYDGGVANLVTLTDISELKEALLKADWRARMLALTEDLCRGASLEIDLQRDSVTVSPGLWSLIGRAKGFAAVGRRAALSWVASLDRPAVLAAWRKAVPGKPFELQHRLRRDDGSLCIVHHRGLIEAGPAGSSPRGVAILQDVTAQRDTERLLNELSSRDALTGLPNRAGFLQRLEASLAALDEAAEQVVLLAVEIPQILQVKQGAGFLAADELVMTLAARLVEAMPASDVVARLSEGEFAVLIRDSRNVEIGDIVASRARALAAALAEPLTLEAAKVFATYAIGAAAAPADGTEAAPLLSSALVAMKTAVEAGAGQVHFASSSGNEYAVRQLALEGALRLALPAQELRLVYQPQMELRQGTMAGVEALLRWNSASLGEVSPVEFIPVAEKSGQIVAIGEWVLRTACAQAASWRREGLANLRVHVNISAAQLAHADLADRIQAILLEAGVEPASLGVEITESMLSDDSGNAARTLNALRAIGVEISLDDFGTGYSNLSTLRALPIDVIKIDRSYVNDVIAAPSEVSMTRAVINLAHSLQMRVLAEGVESEGQLALLLANRCDAMQGYYFSRPVSADQISVLANEGRRLPEQFFARAPKQRTLLLVDDEENIIASLKRLLRRGGYQIVTATSAADGLLRLAENEVDVIVSDQRMPGMTGVEFLRRAKALYPHTIRIVLSGYTELQSITDAINEGAIYKFLTKPWDDELLRANIEEAFRQKEMADENRRLDQEVRTANAGLADLNQRLQASLAQQHEELSLVEDRGRSSQEVLYNVPVPLLGFDTEGLIAFANQDAEKLLRDIGGAGFGAAESLPASLHGVIALNEGESIDIVVKGSNYRCSCRAIGDAQEKRGRLVAIIPLSAPL